MSRFQNNPGVPPFNMEKLYKHFNANAMPADGWGESEKIAGRLNELMIPVQLYPLTSLGLQQGKMLITWDLGDCMGYAIHQGM